MVTVPTGLVAEVSSSGGRKRGPYFPGSPIYPPDHFGSTVSPDRVPIKEKDLPIIARKIAFSRVIPSRPIECFHL